MATVRETPVPSIPAKALEVVATFPDVRPGNPTVTRDGRVIVTMSALIQPEIAANEVLPDGSLRPFPNDKWARRPGADGRGIVKTIGIRAAADGIVWILDMGGDGEAPKLVGWDTVRDRLARVIVLPQSVLRPTSFCQDLAVDVARHKIYIADMTLNLAIGKSEHPAIIVADLDTGLARRVLEAHPSLMPSGDPLIIDGKTIGHKAASGEVVPHAYGLNPIALDPPGRWVYFGAMGGTTIYRIPADALADDGLAADTLASRIERWAERPHCDGFDVDAEGNVYVTDVENDAIGVASPKGYRLLVQDRDRLAWPDGVELTADGWLYIVANQLHRLPGLNQGEDASRPPYYLLRVRV